ncbi:M13 family metallopeptidase [Sediminivirga luteola]|uniref:M13 family metallopeptidase n=1 Tax=Sediminivirga luteola TaxID=1774748 RepID=UPI001F5839F6|nr:M13-type metalloendopeptidase [Sediminivirga luteola]MCI2264398.1 peptidase M13 [Sediminivirga luteola]
MSTIESILPHRDESVSPRDDLFRHVNGAWLSSFTIPADRSGDGAARELVDAAEQHVREIIDRAAQEPAAPGSEAQKIGDLYRSFMDTERIERLGTAPLQDAFAKIAGAGDHSALARVLGELEAEGVPGIIAAYVSADAGAPDRYIAYFQQDGLHLPDESYYREEQYAPIRQKFQEHVEALAALGGLEEHTGQTSGAIAETVLSLETAFAAHHWDVVASRDAEKTYNKVALADLRALLDGFDLDAWMAGLGAGAGAFAHVIVRQPDFLTGAAAVWAARPLDDLKAWLLYSVLDSHASLLNEDIVEEDFAFSGRVLSGAEQNRDRWKRGVSLVEGLLGEAVGKLYVAEHFPPRSKELMLELVGNLIEAYRRSISELPWMGEETRQRALEKLSKFTPKIGYPDKWREYPFEVRADDLVGNYRRAARAEHERQLGRIGQPIDPYEWLMNPQTVNAYYHPVLNEIVFPAGILQPPFFDPDADAALNYGAIGAVIGHEIGHGFDDQGSRYDGDGNLRDWWTEEDRIAFETRTKALIEQYDALVPEGLEPDQHVNGAFTIGENIGDLGGLGIAWKAYQIHLDGAEPPVIEGTTGAQRFFFAWARAWRGKRRTEEKIKRLAVDPHAPEEFRCNQIARNMAAFHEAFEVQPGDAMFLPEEERVTIW